MFRQLLRKGLLTDMDVQAMMADLEREGHDASAYGAAVSFIEAHLDADQTPR